MNSRIVLGLILCLIFTGCGNSKNPIADPQTSKPDVAWSEPVNGLRARLEVLPSEKPQSPFCRVYIEFQNVSDVAGQMKVRFNLDRLTLAVVNKNGKELPIANGVYDGMSPSWEPMLLPFSGTLKFQISFPGLGYKPGTGKAVVDVDCGKAWIIPQDSSTYYLSGTLSIKKEKGDHPRMDWSGTLTLPGVAIPEENRNPRSSDPVSKKHIPPLEGNVKSLQEPPQTAPHGPAVDGLSLGIWSEKPSYTLHTRMNVWKILANEKRDSSGNIIPYDERIHDVDYLLITDSEGNVRRVQGTRPLDGPVGLGFMGGISDILHEQIQKSGTYRLQWKMGRLESNVVEIRVQSQE